MHQQKVQRLLQDVYYREVEIICGQKMFTFNVPFPSPDVHI